MHFQTHTERRSFIIQRDWIKLGIAADSSAGCELRDMAENASNSTEAQ